MLPISDENNKRKVTPVVALLILINVIVFAIEFFWVPDITEFFKKWALIPSQIQLFDPLTWYPFITSMFLHGGVTHIASNMWFLWIFGNNVEEDFGPIGFLVFYLVGGIFASLAQFILMMGSNIPSLGASGAIAAVLGYYMVAFPQNRVRVLVLSRYGSRFAYTSAYYMLFIWGILQFFNGIGSLAYGLNTGGVAWFAHLGGFLFGITVAFISKRLK